MANGRETRTNATRGEEGEYSGTSISSFETLFPQPSLILDSGYRILSVSRARDIECVCFTYFFNKIL